MLRTLRLLAYVCLPLVTLLLASLWAPTAYGDSPTVIYVDKDATGGTGDGSSWANAYTTLQDALDWTNAHGAAVFEIWVAEGVYYPDRGGSHVNNARTESFRISYDNVHLMGGFVGTETLSSQRDPALHPTILSGDIDADNGGNDINTDGNSVAETYADIQGSNTYHVVYLDGETYEPLTTATVLDGFIITGGEADGSDWISHEGGGLYCAADGLGKGCSPTIAYVTFSGNLALGGGGMMSNGAAGGVSSPVLTNVTFTGNKGGGMGNYAANGTSSPTLTNVIFRDNDGRGMVNYGGHDRPGFGPGISSPVLTNVIFRGNNDGGMGNYAEGGASSPVLTNVAFLGNGGSYAGGGMDNTANNSGISSPVLTNVTFGGNQAIYGGGMSNRADNGTSNPQLVNVIMWGNSANYSAEIYNSGATPSITYSDIDQDGISGTGNIRQDPLFVAPVSAGSAPTSSGNYHIRPGSPAADTGTGTGCPATDLDGFTRPLDGNGDGSAICDMGAYETEVLFVDKDAVGGTHDGKSWATAYTTLQDALDWTNAHGKSVFDIWVAEGVYYPDLGGSHVNNARTEAFRVRYDNVQIYGGFAATETLRTQRIPAVHRTILSGDIDGNDTNTDGNSVAETTADIQGNNAYHVLYFDGETNESITTATMFDGFIVTGGKASGTGLDANGGGIFCAGSGTGKGCSPAVATVTFSGNYADTSGGGMFNNGSNGASSPLFTNVSFRGNRADSGGGMFNNGASGGASSPVLINAIFSGNLAASYGGGMFSYGYSGTSSPLLTNVTFGGNQAANFGGGMYNYASNGGASSPQLVNVILWGNGAASGPQIYNDGATPDISYSDVEQDGITGTGNFRQDPLFVAAVSAGSAPTSSGNYHVRPGSPVIDVGSDTGCPATDLDGFTRPLDGNGDGSAICDMGAYETELLFVDQDAVGSTHDGSSWANAFTKLQEALDWTNAHGAAAFEIWVAEGVYYPDLGGSHVNNARTESFRVNYNNVQIYGGFAATETLRTQRMPAVHPTILSGDIDANDTNTDSNYVAETSASIQGSNAYHVLYFDGQTYEALTATTVLDGFIVTGGQAEGSIGSPTAYGGGLLCSGSGAGKNCSPVIANVTFSGNSARTGGGVYNDGSNGGVSSPTLTNVTLTGNDAGIGGGMYNNAVSGTSSPVLANAIFTGNNANVAGGMANYADTGISSPTLTNATFSGNIAATGAGMYNYATTGTSSPVLTNVTFTGNGGTYGAGMYNTATTGASSPLLTNVTFGGNFAELKGGGIYNTASAGTSSPQLVNVIMWGDSAPEGPEIYSIGGTPSISYSDIDQDGITGTGNFRQDPKFVAPVSAGSAPTSSGNYHLRPSSPAIDAGTNTGCPANDLDGTARPADGSGDGSAICDMGAYETPRFGLYVDADATGTDDGSSWANAYKTLQEALDWTSAHNTAAFEIWVAEGVYHPDLGGSHANNERTESFHILYNNVQLYGGFAATETLRSERMPSVHPTILSGDIDGNDTNIDGNHIAETSADIQGNNAYHVLWLDGQASEALTTATIVDGFTITGGSATGSGTQSSGGGIYCAAIGSDKGCSPTVANITFSGNQAINNGGGMENAASGTSSSPVLSYVTFTGNQANLGGGMANDASGSGTTSPVLTNVTFSGNKANNGGGVANLAYGGTSSPVLTNVTFGGNMANSGAGMFNGAAGSGTSSPQLVNVIMWGDGVSSGAEIYNSGATPDISYSDIDQDGITGTGNFRQDPTFVAPVPAGSAPTSGGDYHIRPGSPAVDAGSNTGCPATDLDGTARPLDGNGDGSAICDMGAYETQLLFVDKDAVGGTRDGSSWANAYTTLQDALDWTNAHASGVFDIWVAEGVYYPDLGGSHVTDSQSESFRISYDNVHLLGGFGGSETLAIQRDPAVHRTILSGDIDSNDINNDGNFVTETALDIQGSNAIHVLYFDGETHEPITGATMIDGIIVTGGNANVGGLNAEGGGLFCAGSGAGKGCSPTVANVTFIGNYAVWGAGMYNSGASGGTSSPTLTYVAFTGNIAALGGGMENDGYAGASSPVLTNVIFGGNQGGGMYNNGTSGGVSSPVLTNVTFGGNQADNGGGMYNDASDGGTSSPQLVNVIMWGDLAFGNGPEISNNGATPDISYSDIDQDGITGTGNFRQDPLFKSPVSGTSAPSSSGNYRIRPGSPAADSGTGAGCPAADLDGTARPQDGTGDGTANCDMGAYEAEVVFVDKDAASGTHDGKSWATAFTTIQEALDKTNAHGAVPFEIWVAEGVYYPDLGGSHANNARTESFRINYDNVQIYGGFAATETLRSERMPSAHLTILSGDIDASSGGDDTNTDGNSVAETTADIQGNNAYHVIYLDGATNEALTAGTVLDGFIITGGSASGSGWDADGGGLICAGSGADKGCSPTVANVSFSGNYAGSGGGMANYGVGSASSPLLTGVTFTGNKAGSYGGGMYNEGNSGTSSPVLTKVSFRGNQATYGGAMANGGAAGGTSSPMLTNVVFSGNQATYGGGIFNTVSGGGASSPLLTNVTFGGNRADNGGGMFNYGIGGTSSPQLVNVILWGDSATDGPEILNNGGTPDIAYSDVEQGGITGTGNFRQDPKFTAPVDAGSAPTSSGNYHILPGSPAIDVGSGVACPLTDLDGFTRPGNGSALCDMGAYEAQMLFVDKDAAGADNGSSWGNAFTRLQDALDLANAHGAAPFEIWVAEGVYYPDLGGSHVDNDQNESFRVDYDNMQIYGGFAATETLRSERMAAVHPTILSGDIDADNSGDDTNTDGNNIAETSADIVGDNAYHVLYLDGATNGAITAATVLDGFTVTAGSGGGGSGSDVWDADGGGLVCAADGLGKGCSPTVANGTFSGNYADSGGGMAIFGVNGAVSRPTLTNLTFTGNSAGAGGGVYNYAENASSSPVLANVKFSGNYAGSGGGMSSDAYGGGISSPTLTNVTFTGNAATNGGGIYGYVTAGTSNPLLTNVTFGGNKASSKGGGIYNEVTGGTSSPQLVNGILWGDSAPAGAEIYSVGGTPAISYSDVDQDGITGTGNFRQDPKFVAPVDAGSAPTTTGDYRLRFGSPAADAGTNTGCPPTDLDGLARPAEGHVNGSAICDMGAYETRRLRLYVDLDAGGADNGSSWADAYVTLQGALDWANAHGGGAFEIWVAEGVYFPDRGGSHTADSPSEFFRINYDNVQVYGGFGGTEVERGQRNAALHPTILSGDIDADNGGNDTNNDWNYIAETYADIQGYNAYHVLYFDGETNEAITAATVLDGFIVTGGSASGSNADTNGGGLYCAGQGPGQGCSPTVAYVTFSGNMASDSGGAMFNNGQSGGASSPALTNVSFRGNKASYGGGMINVGVSSPTLTNVTFRGNQATNGGGMLNNGNAGGVSSPTLTNVTFTGNAASDSGGGVYNFGVGGVSSPLLTNVTFSGNKASYGGAMYNSGDFGASTPELVNVIMWGDSALMGAEIYYGSFMAEIAYSDIDQDGIEGTGNFRQDPKFVAPVNADTAPTTTGDYRIRAGSPTIDAGTNTGCPATDLAGATRPSDGNADGNAICDMGAYELQLVFVDEDATGGDDGSSWANAFTKLQDALDLANTSGAGAFEIWVAEGVYYPDLGGSHVADSQTEWFRINYDNVQIYGGFAGTETLRTQRSPEVHRTILSGDIDADNGGNDINTDGNNIAETSADIQGSNAYHVLWLDGEINGAITAATILDGFIITAGQANSGYLDTRGGGLYCNGYGTDKGCSPTVANVTFSGNYASSYGGGMFGYGGSSASSSPVITNVIFSGNQAGYGGGIYNYGEYGTSAPALTNVTFSGNQAGSGGGMYNYGYDDGISSPTLTNVTFTGNKAKEGGGMYSYGEYGTSSPVLNNVTFTGNQAGSGGAMYNYGYDEGTSSPVLANVTFSGNEADTGGGMYNYADYASTCNPVLTNVTFSGNTATSNGAGMYNQVYDGGTSNSQLVNVIMWGDSAPDGAEIYNDGATVEIAYSDIDQDGIAGTGNFRQDPLLSSLGDHGGGMLTFALLPGSPAIDTGDGDACAAAPVNNLDQRGASRPQGSGCDIGAYESRGLTLATAGGTPQSTSIFNPFALPLTVTVSSAPAEPLGPGGIVITLTPPTTGSGLSVTAPFTITTDAEGVAASAVITANGIVGSFNVTATAAGVGTTAVFSLTNTQNAPPQARADVAAVLQDTPLLIDVLANDIPGTSPQLTVYAATQPLAGGVTSIEQNKVRFTPTAGFTGLVTFTSTIQDGNGLADSAPVAVRVTALNSTDGEPQVLSLPAPADNGRGTVTVPAGSTEIEVPADAITPAEDSLATYDLVYQELNAPEPSLPSTLFTFGGRAFVLQLFINAELQPDYVFNVPIYVTISYDPNVVTDTSKLVLYYYDEGSQQWANDGITILSVDTQIHTFRASLAHLTEFAAGITVPTGLDPNLEPQILPQLFMPQVYH